MQANEYFNILKQIGWFVELPKCEEKRLRKELSIALKECPDYAFYVLAVCSVNLDFYFVSGGLTYTLNQMAKACFGLLQPTEVQEKILDNDIIYFSFKHKKNTYSIKIDKEDKAIHEKILALVNHALQDSQLYSQLLELPRCDDSAEMVLTSKIAYQQAINKGLIPNYRDWLSRLEGDDKVAA